MPSYIFTKLARSLRPSCPAGLSNLTRSTPGQDGLDKNSQSIIKNERNKENAEFVAKKFRFIKRNRSIIDGPPFVTVSYIKKLRVENLKLRDYLIEFEKKVTLSGPIDKDNTKDIWDAILKGSLRAVKYYEAQDPSLLSKSKEKLNNSTPLHLAAKSGNFEIVIYLLSKGVEVDPTNDSCATPLMGAAVIGRLTIVDLLIDHGADVNHQDNTKKTALHWAVYLNQLEVVKVLIERGADRMIRDDDNQTPLEFAIWRRDRFAMVDYLSSLEEHNT